MIQLRGITCGLLKSLTSNQYNAAGSRFFQRKHDGNRSMTGSKTASFNIQKAVSKPAAAEKLPVEKGIRFRECLVKVQELEQEILAQQQRRVAREGLQASLIGKYSSLRMWKFELLIHVLKTNRMQRLNRRKSEVPLNSRFFMGSLLDQHVGVGKSWFALHYIQKCRESS